MTTKYGFILRNLEGRLTSSAKAAQLMRFNLVPDQRAAVERAYWVIEIVPSFAKYTPKRARCELWTLSESMRAEITISMGSSIGYGLEPESMTYDLSIKHNSSECDYMKPFKISITHRMPVLCWRSMEGLQQPNLVDTLDTFKRNIPTHIK